MLAQKTDRYAWCHLHWTTANPCFLLLLHHGMPSPLPSHGSWVSRSDDEHGCLCCHFFSFLFFFFFVVKLRVSPSTLPNPPPSSSSSSSSQANPLDSLGKSLAIITATSCSVAIVVVLCAVVGRARPLSRAIPNHMQNLQQRSPAYIRNQTHQKSVQTPRSMQRCGFDILQLEDSVQGGPTWCLLQRCTEADVLCCCHLAYKCELVL